MRYRVLGIDHELQDEPIEGAINSVFNDDGTLFGHMWVPIVSPKGYVVHGCLAGLDVYNDKEIR